MQYKLNAKILGIIVVVLALFVAFTFYYSSKDIFKAQSLECKQHCEIDLNTAQECPYARSIPLQSYLGYTLSAILLLIGIYALFSSGKYKEQASEKQKDLENRVRHLPDEEKKIAELILNDNNVIFQSELIEKSGFSKVKISRILDRLEGKGLIERRRQGMTNLVLLKNN